MTVARPTPLTDADVFELVHKLMAYSARQGLAPPPLRVASGAITPDPKRVRRWAESIGDHAYKHRNTPGAQQIVNLMMSVGLPRG